MNRCGSSPTAARSSSPALASPPLVKPLSSSEAIRRKSAAPAGTYYLIVDGRNLLDPEQARAAGFLYESVGRPSMEPVV